MVCICGNWTILDSDVIFIIVGVIKKCVHLQTSSKNVHPVSTFPKYTYICTSYLLPFTIKNVKL